MKQFLFIYITIFSIILCTQCTQKEKYIYNEGFIFGTTYHLKYKSDIDYHQEIISLLNEFNNSLSTYNKNSVISKINSNEDLKGDKYFIECFSKAQEISRITNGAFDMTVAPLVNAWGFGFNSRTKNDSATIDSIMQFIGYTKVYLKDSLIIKDNPNIMLDASAIAKGYGVDITSEYLINQGVTDLMVEIGGEIRAKGINSKGELWKIGIDKPIDDQLASKRVLQDVVNINNKSLATSGNYRQFYEKDGIKYSHTINPNTGFPERNTLLSASVLANDCLTADAFATAFMVMGINKSIELSESLDYLEVYFIYSDTLNSELKIYKSENFGICN